VDDDVVIGEKSADLLVGRWNAPGSGPDRSPTGMVEISDEVAEDGTCPRMAALALIRPAE